MHCEGRWQPGSWSEESRLWFPLTVKKGLTSEGTSETLLEQGRTLGQSKTLLKSGETSSAVTG